MEDTITIFCWTIFVIVIIKCIFDFNLVLFHSYFMNIIILAIVSIITLIIIAVKSTAYTKQSYICGQDNPSVAFYATIFPFIFLISVKLFLGQYVGNFEKN